jgi:hypothetical protein
MRRSLLAILALAALVAAGTAFATSSPTHTVTGTLKSIDLTSRTFSLETHKKTESYKLGEKAQVEQESPYKTLNLDQLKVGEQVKVSYSMVGQERMASLLKVMPESKTTSYSTPNKSKSQ